MENNKNLDQLFRELNKAQNDLQKKQNNIENVIIEEVESLGTIETRQLSEEEGINYSDLKNQFGKLFYGALCPINGVSPKNKRLADGSNEGGYSGPAGPAVWKKIGWKHSYSSRINWYENSEVFDKLVEAHVDLAINGERNRLDQVKVIKDMFEARNFIKEKLDKIVGERAEVPLSTSYDIQVLVITDNKPLFAFTKAFDMVNIKGTDLHIPMQLSPSEEDLLKQHNISINTYNFNEVALPLLTKNYSKDNIRGNFSWNDNYMLIGLSKIIADSAIDNYFESIKDDKLKGIQRFQELQERYVTRLLMKGVF